MEVTQRSGAFFVQDQVRLLAGRLQLSGAFRTQAFALQTPRFTACDGSSLPGAEL